MSCALEDKTNLLVSYHTSIVILSFGTDGSGQTVMPQIRLLMQTKVRIKVTEMYIHAISGSLLFELRRGKTGFLHMGKQRRRSASR